MGGEWDSRGHRARSFVGDVEISEGVIKRLAVEEEDNTAEEGTVKLSGSKYCGKHRNLTACGRHISFESYIYKKADPLPTC